MTATVQGSLFDLEPTAPAVELDYACPRSGYTWDKGIGRDFHRHYHTFPLGDCRCQGIRLWFVRIRRTLHGRTQIVWSDGEGRGCLLRLILEAKAFQCDDETIQQALSLSWENPGDGDLYGGDA